MEAFPTNVLHLTETDCYFNVVIGGLVFKHVTFSTFKILNSPFDICATPQAFLNLMKRVD